MVALTLLSAVLLAAAVIAVPSSNERHAARLSGRRNGRGSSLPMNVTVHATDKLLAAHGPTTMSSVTSTNWAGGVYSYPQNSIKAVTATFTLPKPRTPPGGNANTQYYCAAWVGIDGASCTSAILQTGVDMDVQGSSVSYNAWYEWYPAGASDFSGISFNTGDSVSLTVTATSKTSGTVVVTNNSNGQSVTHAFSGAPALCEQDAEWILESFLINGSQVQLDNFGSVAFTGHATLASGAHIGVGNVNQWNIVNSAGKIITSTSTSANNVLTVSYIG